MKFILNKKEVSIEVPQDTPLLWVIREEFELTGTKFGCGKGLCGSCTVHLNGTAIRSCITPIAAVENQEITTIEGLAQSQNDKEHTLQKSWKKFNVPQCGYCQPGQIMNAAGLLNNNPKPTSEEIKNAMAGNICRCGTYQRIQKAIEDVV